MTTTTRRKPSKSVKTTPVQEKRKAMPARQASKVPVKARVRRVRHVVETDEERTRVGEDPSALSVDTGAGVDELGEELGEAWVENVTGADDASNDPREQQTDAEAVASGD